MKTRLIVMQIADVDDDDANEDLERDAGDEHRQHEVVEPMSLATNVEQQLQLGDLGQREDGNESRLGLGLGLFEFAVSRQQLRPYAQTTRNKPGASTIAVDGTQYRYTYVNRRMHDTTSFTASMDREFVTQSLEIRENSRMFHTF